MPLVESDDFAARRFDASESLTVHEHGFPAANTALGHWLDFPDAVHAKHREFLAGALRVDIFAVHQGNDIDAPATAPLRPGRASALARRRVRLRRGDAHVAVGTPVHRRHRGFQPNLVGSDGAER